MVAMATLRSSTDAKYLPASIILLRAFHCCSIGLSYGSVGGQEHHPEPVLVGLDKLGDGFRFVAWCVVQDQQYLGIGAQHRPQEPLERLGVAGIDGADVDAIKPQHAEDGHRLSEVAGLEGVVSVGWSPPAAGIGPEAGVHFIAGEHREPLYGGLADHPDNKRHGPEPCIALTPASTPRAPASISISPNPPIHPSPRHTAPRLLILPIHNAGDRLRGGGIRDIDYLDGVVPVACDHSVDAPRYRVCLHIACPGKRVKPVLAVEHA